MIVSGSDFAETYRQASAREMIHHEKIISSVSEAAWGFYKELTPEELHELRAEGHNWCVQMANRSKAQYVICQIFEELATKAARIQALREKEDALKIELKKTTDEKNQLWNEFMSRGDKR